MPGEGDYKPRLCTLRKWDNFTGYGFNLQAEKGKPGQFIGYVDTNSPADSCGLRKNDRVIEVNGVNVCNESHKQVVARIREHPDEVSLLVMDPATEKHFLENGIIVKGNMDFVEKREVTKGSPNGVAPVGDPEPTSIPEPLPEEHAGDNQEMPIAEDCAVPFVEATADLNEAELVKETEELKVEETTSEAPVEEVEEMKEEAKEEVQEEMKEEVKVLEAKEEPKGEVEIITEEEKVEEKVEEVEISPEEAPTEIVNEEVPAHEEIKSTPIADDDANHVTPDSNHDDVKDIPTAANDGTDTTHTATVAASESAPIEASSNSVNGKNHSSDPMSVFQKPAAEVRAMHGRSKRRAIKETNQTFKEKYLMFENL